MVDYENVGSNGLVGYNELQKSDHVYIFYTKDAKNVGWDIVKDIITNRGEVEWWIQEVDKKRKGDQSLDFCLASYLGHLITVNQGKDCSYVIVSKDDGYDSVIKFWNESKDVKVMKREVIKAPADEQDAKNKTATKKVPGTKNTASAGMEPIMEPESDAKNVIPVKKSASTKRTTVAKQTAKEQNTIKAEFNREIQEILRQAKYSNEDINEIAEIVTACYEEANPDVLKRNVHNELQKKYDTAQEIYHNIEPVLSIYSAMPVSVSVGDASSDKTAVNNIIQQILSKAKVSADVIGYVTSTVVKNIGVKNGKQLIYRAIISKYGQKKGLDIYNRIKKYIP